ncbi:MAG: questin oxidase family protein [Acidimicrobiales bacterium]
MKDPDRGGSLDELLDKSLTFDATTERGLTNHLPMALVAKAGLGASLVELRRFSTRYSRRLVPAGSSGHLVTKSDWQSAVGKKDAYVDLTRFFDDEVRELGIEGAVRTYLTYLLPGISGAAFHGVIRLAYSLDVDSPERVGTALAYLASSAMELAPLEDVEERTDDPEVLLVEMTVGGAWASVPATNLISDEMRWVGPQPGFSSFASSLQVDDSTPRRLAAAALKVYASTNNFTALHGVTGMEALARLRRYAEDTERFDRYSFQALAAAFATIGAPAVWSADQLAVAASSTVLDEETVRHRAAWSDDEHVAKLVFTSQRLHERQPDPLYQFVSERAVTNDPSSQGDDRNVDA